MFKTLPLFENLHELARLDQSVVSSSIQPCVAPAQPLNRKLAAAHISDFQFTAIGKV